jgi:putative nucleotidyltransferase with HDIG domain
MIRMAATCAAIVVAVLSVSSDTRARAWEALRARLHEEKYLRHSLAVEAMMREMAGAKGAGKDEWGLAGLLHDIDLATTAGEPSHGVTGAQWLRELGFSDSVAHAVEAHDDGAGVGFPSPELNAADPQALWRRIQKEPAQKERAAKTSKECAAAGFGMPQAIEAARAASRKLTPTSAPG